MSDLSTQQPVENGTFNGTRKLIRPHLPAGERRRDPMQVEDPLSHALAPDHDGSRESSHAEAFYYQKQVQQRTEMTVILDDGEELHGIIEWYDKCVLKIRSGRRRIMVYKSGIKYLFKSSEENQHHTVMK